MPRYQLRLEWTDDYADRETAKEDLRQIWEEIEHLAHDPDNPKTLEVFDVVPIPPRVPAPQLHVTEEEYLEAREPVSGDAVLSLPPPTESEDD